MKKESLGGWLLFFYVALILGVVVLVLSIITAFQIANLSTIANIILIVAILNVIIGITERSKKILKLVDYYFIAFAISAITDYFIYNNFSSIIGAVIGIAIWRRYFHTAPRIKKTFGIK